jgi:CDP-paratose 2-epimerase
MRSEYVDQARKGDHIWYISDLCKMRRHYPDWDVTKSLDDIFDEVVDAWLVRVGQASALAQA